jgi:hypothetical protein
MDRHDAIWIDSELLVEKYAAWLEAGEPENKPAQLEEAFIDLTARWDAAHAALKSAHDSLDSGGHR